jgi:hypothetical protein
MGRSGYDTTNPASYRSAAAYNAIAMHRAQKLIEQVSRRDREKGREGGMGMRIDI